MPNQRGGNVIHIFLQASTIVLQVQNQIGQVAARQVILPETFGTPVPEMVDFDEADAVLPKHNVPVQDSVIKTKVMLNTKKAFTLNNIKNNSGLQLFESSHSSFKVYITYFVSLHKH